MARAFAAAGAKVALVARSEGPLKELAGELDGEAFPADLTDAEQVAGLIERVEAEAGPVDVLVNNAGSEAVGWFPALTRTRSTPPTSSTCWRRPSCAGRRSRACSSAAAATS